ncbi:MAG TPA: ABC transporter ATP-binding protein [Rectinemataceae bacterium]|nr:ABC transporter ATP-binding protein [Rectinemataceae bacterium]
MSSVVVRDVSKSFVINGETFQALKGVSFEVGDHEIVSLIGPSGCGKSTLLRLIGGLLPRDSGDISVCGLSPGEARRRQKYSFVFQDAVLFPWRSVIRNVQLPLEINKTVNDRKDARRRAAEMLSLVGLKGFEEASPNQLSGGMRHRVALARALIMSPPLIFMDEPFAALDEITRDKMNIETLRIWSETKASILFVTHSIEEAVFLSDRVLVFSTHPGELLADIHIELPRPRVLELKQDAACFKYTNEIRQILAQSLRRLIEEDDSPSPSAADATAAQASSCSEREGTP